MTTTTSSTSTSSAGSSIATTLGIGSGLDISTLVTNLAAAEKAPQEALITTREAANTAKVSALATITSSIDSFATALTTLVSGGTLYTQPTTSNTSAIAVSAIAGTRISSDLAANLQVNALAQAQTLVSGSVGDAGAAIGTGTLTLKTSSGSYKLTLDSTNNSLTGLAAAINNASANVTASIIADGSGSRLVVKGAAGAASAFTLAADTGADAGLSAYTYPAATGTTGMTQAQQAQDASLVLDGVTVTRASNSISDLIPGVKLNLKTVTTGSGAVTIGATQPTDAMASAVSDFVSAFNEVKSTLDTATASSLNGATAGAFANDSSIRGMIRQLAGLTSTPLVSSGSITTLADLGISTGTDGKLVLNTVTLNAVLASNPDGVEALFNPVQTSSTSKVQIKSAIGAAAPGSYTLTNMVAGPPPSGNINGVAMIVAGSRLVAPVKSGASGLVLALTGDVSSATVTVEPGLAGALKSIRDGLRSSTGPLQAISTTLTAQAKTIATDRTAMQTRADAYAARLQTSFTTMNTRVSTLKATQSYLDQQIKVWTNSTDSSS